MELQRRSTRGSVERADALMETWLGHHLGLAGIDRGGGTEGAAGLAALRRLLDEVPG